MTQDEVHDYATRPSRTILETLADFRHTRILLSHILEILPPLRRRQFSIASSWNVRILCILYTEPDCNYALLMMTVTSRSTTTASSHCRVPHQP
jgi:hypothetical protein